MFLISKSLYSTSHVQDRGEGYRCEQNFRRRTNGTLRTICKIDLNLRYTTHVQDRGEGYRCEQNFRRRTNGTSRKFCEADVTLYTVLLFRRNREHAHRQPRRPLNTRPCSHQQCAGRCHLIQICQHLNLHLALAQHVALARQVASLRRLH